MRVSRGVGKTWCDWQGMNMVLGVDSRTQLRGCGGDRKARKSHW